VLSDPIARVAATENNLRYNLAEVLETLRKNKGLSIEQFAKAIGASLTQTKRLLHLECGGTLTLKTIVQAADYFGYREICLTLKTGN